MDKKDANKPLMPSIKKLGMGESLSFSLDKVLSVRSICSLLSLQNDALKFRTKSDRKTKTVTVERIM